MNKPIKQFSELKEGDKVYIVHYKRYNGFNIPYLKTETIVKITNRSITTTSKHEYPILLYKSSCRFIGECDIIHTSLIEAKENYKKELSKFIVEREIEINNNREVISMCKEKLDDI